MGDNLLVSATVYRYIELSWIYLFVDVHRITLIFIFFKNLDVIDILQYILTTLVLKVLSLEYKFKVFQFWVSAFNTWKNTSKDI